MPLTLCICFHEILARILTQYYLAKNTEEISTPAPKRSKSKVDKSAKSEKSIPEKATGKGSRGGKKKADKDPNAPKKPLTAFMLFTNKRRPEIMVKTPGLKITEISTVIGKEWKELTNEEKEVI